MSAREALVAAVVAALRAAPGLAAAGVFDAPPVRAALPWVQVDEPPLADWSTKSWTGREGRLTVAAHDGGERPVRLRALQAAAEAAVLGLAGDLGGGCTARGKPGPSCRARVGIHRSARRAGSSVHAGDAGTSPA